MPTLKKTKAPHKKDLPGQCQPRQHRHIEIESLRVVILVAEKTPEVMLKKEFIDEYQAVPIDHRNKPDGRHGECKWDPPEETGKEFLRGPFATNQEIRNY